MVKKQIITCIKNVMDNIILKQEAREYYLRLSAFAASEELIQAFLSCLVQREAVESSSLVNFSSHCMTDLTLNSPFVIACDYPNITEEGIELLIPPLGHTEVLTFPVYSERSPAYYYLRKYYRDLNADSEKVNGYVFLIMLMIY